VSKVSELEDYMDALRKSGDSIGARINIVASNITALEQTNAGNRARVDGGGGVDTLKLDGAGNIGAGRSI
jgi:chorismate synthase